MKIQFSASQTYQIQAVQSVVRIFEGQNSKNSLNFTEKGIGNHLEISENQVLENIRKVQAENGLRLSSKLENLTETLPFVPQISLEMETGTGKTYVFLRTIYELHQAYGFKKFVIVVPSVAIREGVLKNLQITQEHFQGIYGSPEMNYFVYDRQNLPILRHFASSNALQILVINIDSFAKDSNVINAWRETGVRPIEYVQTARPVVIIDEAQNFETDLRKQALAQLHPLCCLRYSATHRHFYQLVYSLNPVQAYDWGLVKQIEVDGITQESQANTAFIHYQKAILGKKQLKAQLSIFIQENGRTKLKDVIVAVGEDLGELSGGLEAYKNLILNEIRVSESKIIFSNGWELTEGQRWGEANDEIMRFQIERTVEHHVEKLQKLQGKGIKVLSLFFIDKVSNYRTYDLEGKPQKGKLAQWFEEFYEKQQKKHPNLLPFSAEMVHNGYFSMDSKHKIWADTKGTSTKDEDTYHLIMRDKERLLSLDEPLQFIFSHSALREGWDNPNVFQICTLNETRTELKKRQEIGRGLRLPVDQQGRRVQDKNLNVLTVIANESYEAFSRALQAEIKAETRLTFENRIRNAQKKEILEEKMPFLEKKAEMPRNEIWLEKVISAVRKMPPTTRPMLSSQTAQFEYGQKNAQKTINTQVLEETQSPIPDVYAYIQSQVQISRKTIAEILLRSERYEELLINPPLFLDNLVGCIRRNAYF